MHTRSKRVSRCLFGKPDHEELQKWLTKELQAIQMEQVKLYAFDFKKEQPIPCTASKAYVFEAVPENEVPEFYRTTYYSSSERRKRFVPPPLVALKYVKEEKEVEDAADVVAYHTRSRETAAAAANTSTFILPKIPKIRTTVASPQRGNRIQRLAPRKSRRTVKKLSQSAGVRKKHMKQSLLTNYLPVVRKRRSLTHPGTERTNGSPKLLDGNPPMRVDCLGAKVLGVSNTGVKTRCQSGRCPPEPISKRLRSAF